MGARVTGLVGSENKKEVVQSLGAYEVLTYEEHEKNPGKYDIILNASAGKSLKTDFQRLLPAGTLVGYGASQLVGGSRRSWWRVGCLLWQNPSFSTFRMENKGVFGLNLLKYLEHSSSRILLQGFLKHILQRFADGSFRTCIGKTFPLQEAGDAHRYLQSRENIGKIVLTPAK
jgi:NADPH:quinone reductase-like Zn-dependent oxidoreductase